MNVILIAIDTLRASEPAAAPPLRFAVVERAAGASAVEIADSIQEALAARSA